METLVLVLLLGVSDWSTVARLRVKVIDKDWSCTGVVMRIRHFVERWRVRGGLAMDVGVVRIAREFKAWGKGRKAVHVVTARAFDQIALFDSTCVGRCCRLRIARSFSRLDVMIV